MSKKIRIGIIVICIVVCVLLIKELLNQKIASVDDFQNYMQQFGIAGPLVLGIFQAFQVAVPVLPGYLGCVGGALAYGWFVGFLCNYIGICVGSIGAYYLGKRYGMDIVLSMFPEKQCREWTARVEKSKSYAWFLFIATLLPLFPDDFLCYFSGLIKMDSKKFFWIIILGKPWCILGYSLIFGFF